MKPASVPTSLALVIAVAGLPAHANDEVSYTYAEASYVRSSVDVGSTSIDGDGGRGELSIEFPGNIYAIGSFELNDLDVLPGLPTVDLDILTAGVGWHTHLSGEGDGVMGFKQDRWSLFAEARFIQYDTGVTTDGYKARVGTRVVNHTNFEFLGAIGYEDIEDSNGDLTLEARLLYSVTNSVQIQVGVDWFEDFTRGFAGVRFDFGSITR